MVTCSNVEIRCKLNCKEKIKHIDHEKHVKHDCLNREYICEFCRHKSTYTEITGEAVMTPHNPAASVRPIPPEKRHYAQCPEYPKICPNKCGKTITRKLVKAHHTVCPKEIVRCRRNFWQCNEEMERQLLANHRQHECLYRRYTCQFCNKEETYTGITGETVMKKHDPSSAPNPEYNVMINPPPERGHYAWCPDYPKTCPNECGMMIQRGLSKGKSSMQ